MPTHATDQAATRDRATRPGDVPAAAAAPSDDGHVRVTGLGKQLGDTRAVDDVSFDIAPGTLTCLLGPSGCGKTTTLRMVAGLLDPDEGDVLIGGRSMRGVPANRRPTSIVFQDYALFPHMTVRDNVAFGLRRQEGGDRDATVAQLLEVMSLDAVADRRPGSLSGGQQQRVALARSLALRPAVVLMDEPLSNLDAKVRITLRAELRRIQHEFGTTILYVTHDQEEAMAIADEIVVMSAGQVQQIGAAPEVYRRPTTPFVADFIGLGSWLSARCTSSADDVTTFEVDGGTVRAARPSAPLDATPDDEVVLFARPEHVTVAPPDGDDGIVTTLRSRQFMGSFERLVLETSSGQTILMDEHDGATSGDVEEGDELTVRIAAHRLRVFDHAPDGSSGAPARDALGGGDRA